MSEAPDLTNGQIWAFLAIIALLVLGYLNEKAHVNRFWRREVEGKED